MADPAPAGPASQDPSAQELAAFSAGALAPERFEEVDRWLARLEPGEQERLLGQPLQAGSLAAAAPMLAVDSPTPFQSDLHGQHRFVHRERIGSGGMGVVELLFDEVLKREIVLKRCRPRHPDEEISDYVRRQQLFKREAQLTARLEHPGIVPVHDCGEGPLGEPSFTMKRLEGEPLTTLIERRREGAPFDPVQAAEIILRVADAVAYAHRRGVVHRDLKPENIIVGQLGAVYVIDWGLAGEIGSVPDTDLPAGDRGISGSGMGTPAWMAPEQFGLVRADPRMDVFAIGGLMMAALTGSGPRERGVARGSSAVQLAPLGGRFPRSLVAVARRCLELEPRRRYADAAQVADELRQYLAAGLTSAEQAAPLARAMLALRRSPRLSAALIGVATTLLCLGSAWSWWSWSQKAEARAEIQQLARTTPPTDLERMRTARERVQQLLRSAGDLPSGRALSANLSLQIAALQHTRQQQELTRRLDELDREVRLRGTWIGEADELGDAIRAFGVSLDPARIDQDAALIAASPLRVELLLMLAQLLGAEVIGGGEARDREEVPRLITAASPDAGFRALGRLLEHPLVRGHDLALPDRAAALVDVAGSADAADAVLSLFDPTEPAEVAGTPSAPSLRPLIEARLREDPGAFWPRIAAARAALTSPDYHAVERHALVALGTEPQSMWPHLLLAYAELGAKDWPNLLTFAVVGLSVNPDQVELKVLRAVAMAALGSRVEAQQLVDSSGAGALLRWHLLHPCGHPLELGVAELLRGQRLSIPPAAPRWGPLVVRGGKPVR